MWREQQHEIVSRSVRCNSSKVMRKHSDLSRPSSVSNPDTALNFNFCQAKTPEIVAVLRESKAVSRERHETHRDSVGIATLKGRGVSRDG